MNYSLTKQQVLSEFESSSFILKTQQQIAKDLAPFSIEFNTDFVTNSLFYDDILIELGNKLAELMKFGETQFMQYLYQVDLPEKEFLNLLNDPKFLPKISELILRREAYKVYLRAKF
ncbi:MAG: hypothetical protein COA33_006455 [Fluviicola sp.]|nr:hypothetical protein [Fluviicola sp.]